MSNKPEAQRSSLSDSSRTEPDRAVPDATAPLRIYRTERPSGSLVVGGWKKRLYVTLAGGCFLLGMLGALLPGLPTTPFLLLTSFFLIRSSPRLNDALLRSRLFGPILADWQLRGGVRRNVKVKAVVVVVAAVAITIYLTGRSLVPGLAVILLASVGIAVILRLPSARDS